MSREPTAREHPWVEVPKLPLQEEYCWLGTRGWEEVAKGNSPQVGVSWQA